MSEVTAKPIKPPTTIDQQIEIIKKRKLLINNIDKAKKILNRVNYYRLSAYFKPFLITGTDDFVAGTTIEDVFNAYIFDEELRLLVFNMIENVEITFRRNIAYHLTIKYNDSKIHRKDKIYKDIYTYKKFIDYIDKETKYTTHPKEVFVNHYKINYGNKYPIWVIVETLTMGSLSRFYKNLKTSEKREISNKFYALNYLIFESWLEYITITRNICAHHGRLHNRFVSCTPKFPHSLDEKVPNYNKIFSAIVMLKELNQGNKSWFRFVYKLNKLINRYNVKNLKAMGFPENWKTILLSNKWEVLLLNILP